MPLDTSFTLTDGADILAPYLTAERRADDARETANRAEAQRSSGVCWSGMGPEPFTRRSEERLRADALERMERREAFLASPRGRFMKATFDLGSLGYNEAETVRAIYSRSLADERQPVNVEAVGRALRILNEISHSDARDAIAALADMLAPALARAA